MFCGYFAVISSLQGNFVTAAWAIMLSIVFDSMDGRVARMTSAVSAFGIEYDSLSDLISFGLAPALMAYKWALEPFGRMGWLATFLYLACAALRLARFNVSATVAAKSYFQGLPSPVAAASIATSILFYHELSLELPKQNYMLAMVLLLGSLMVSMIRFVSLKDLKVNRENAFGILAVVTLVFVLLAIRPEITLFVMCVGYIAFGFVSNLVRLIRERTQPASTSTTTSMSGTSNQH